VARLKDLGNVGDLNLYGFVNGVGLADRVSCGAAAMAGEGSWITEPDGVDSSTTERGD
jgi:hypothetical protein